MCRLMLRPLAQIASCGLACGSLIAQTDAPPKAAPPKIEPGLEEAVNWKWSVVPSATKQWGMPLPEELTPKAPDSPAAPPGTGARPTTYEVQKGDAIIKIARKFSMTAAQLKQFNELKTDRIIIGQVLRIPTPGELLAMEPPPPPPEAERDKEGSEVSELEMEPTSPEQLELETVLLQVFLDREMFSSGAIDGNSGPVFQKVRKLYEETHPGTAGVALKAKALAAVKQPYTSYLLRAEDFRFIKPRKAAPTPTPDAKPVSARKKKGAKPAPTLPPVPPLTYDELVAADFLGYASVWEFVAERFHCDEAFLRRLNANLEETPVVGTAFQVPNVIPFEIEKALDPPLQPSADPQKPVTAAVVGLSFLQISREGKLIAVMPLASARPGLNGRGSWTVLDAIPQPRMSTRREPREAPKAPVPASGKPAEAALDPAAAPEQVLPAGPNNPVGIVWIHLAKAKSTEPLPYGLHGTSIPAQMKSQEGIGGLRLANWDIARAVRLMPAGTPLQWPAIVNPRARR
jgi:LysM repeat protein/lipoprotein-anchoring transpeptidase ErfK/SrfK